MAVACVALLSGCGGAASATGPVEIRYWTGWTGHELESQKRLVGEFNRSHPRIRVRILSVANAYQKVRISFAGGSTPDVCSAIWADELAGYAMRGILTPLDGYLARSGRSGSEFVPGVWRMVQYRGRPYALAVTTNTNFIVYNKRIFREAGLDPERPPRTIAELDRAAAACTKLSPDGGFVRYGFRPNGLVTWAYVFGGRWYDPELDEITADDARNIETLRWMASYAGKYDVARIRNFESTFGGNSTPSGPFFVGKVAMMQTGEYMLEHIRRYAPELEWGWFALPSPPGGRPRTTGASGSVFAMPSASKHKDEAWEFLDWITRPRAVEEFCGSIGNLPPLLASGREKRFTQEPLFRFALDLAAGENVFGPPGTPVWPRYTQDIRRAEEQAIFGRLDPGTALAELDRQMEREAARVRTENP